VSEGQKSLVCCSPRSQLNGRELEQVSGDGERQGSWRAAGLEVAMSQTLLSD